MRLCSVSVQIGEQLHRRRYKVMMEVLHSSKEVKVINKVVTSWLLFWRAAIMMVGCEVFWRKASACMAVLHKVYNHGSVGALVWVCDTSISSSLSSDSHGFYVWAWLSDKNCTQTLVLPLKWGQTNLVHECFFFVCLIFLSLKRYCNLKFTHCYILNNPSERSATWNMTWCMNTFLAVSDWRYILHVQYSKIYLGSCSHGLFRQCFSTHKFLAECDGHNAEPWLLL